MSTDEQALRTMVEQLVTAWNTADSAGFSAHFLDDATFIHIYGGELVGRGAITAAHQQIFDTIYKGSRNHYTIVGIRFVRPDVAVVRLQARLQFYPEGKPREIEARPTIVAVREGGKWQIVTFQNTRITEMPNLANAAGGTKS